jgi:magnesium transporter
MPQRPVHPGLCSPRFDETDHIRRVQEEIDALREALAFAFEASR